MKTVNRGLLALFSFLSIIVYAVLIALLSGWRWPVNYLQRLLLLQDQRLIIIAIAAIMLILAFVLLLASLSREKTGTQALVEENTLGGISVTVTAVENLVNRIVTQVPGVREVKQRISLRENGVEVTIKASVTPDIIIPETAQQIQQLVTQGVSEVTGLVVSRVLVGIEDIAAAAPKPVKTTKSRVE